MPSISSPSLQRVDASEPEKVIQAIIEDGCVIIENFTTPAIVDAVNDEVNPYLRADKPWNGSLFPPSTRRCARLVSRSKTVRENWLIHPLVSQVTDFFLSKTTSNYYGAEKHTYTTRPIINIATSLEINPGGAAQRLHRDDKNHHVTHLDQTKTGYQVGSDLSMAFLIPGVDTTLENGATLAIPGSHLWGLDRIPQVKDAGYATMKKGEAYCMLGGTYHAGGANNTTDQRRPMHGLFWCQGILRTEENQYLVNSPEEVLSWPEEVQRKMGFHLSSPNIGFADFRSPIEFFRGTEFDAYTDPDPAFTGELEPVK